MPWLDDRGDTTYKEGAGYPALTPFSIDYAFVRDTCGKGRLHLDVRPVHDLDAQGHRQQRRRFHLRRHQRPSAGPGSPGRRTRAFRRRFSATALFATNLLDANVATTSPPNRFRDFTSDPPNNSTFGTLSVRRRFVNNTGGSVTRLRFRIIDVTTFPAISGIADLRPRTSVAVVVAGITDAATCSATGSPATPPCSATVQGTTLETPPAQPNGSGFNGSMSAGTVTLGTPLANGASIDLQFLLGIQQTGNFRIYLNIEALP